MSKLPTPEELIELESEAKKAWQWLVKTKGNKIPRGIPRDPEAHYSKTGEWISYVHLLGWLNPDGTIKK